MRHAARELVEALSLPFGLCDGSGGLDGVRYPTDESGRPVRVIAPAGDVGSARVERLGGCLLYTS
ncbi:hypothetical protein, partial [Halorubrum kocurii]